MSESRAHTLPRLAAVIQADAEGVKPRCVCACVCAPAAESERILEFKKKNAKRGGEKATNKSHVYIKKALLRGPGC